MKLDELMRRANLTEEQVVTLVSIVADLVVGAIYLDDLKEEEEGLAMAAYGTLLSEEGEGHG